METGKRIAGSMSNGDRSRRPFRSRWQQQQQQQPPPPPLVQSKLQTNKHQVGHYGGKENETIYYILKPALFIGKFIGIFPVSGAYESPRIKQSLRRILFDRIIPIAANLWLTFMAYVIFNIFMHGVLLTMRQGVDFYSIVITNTANVLMSWMPTFAAYFRNERMSHFLKRFSDVDNVLSRHKYSARRRILVIYTVLIILQVIKSWSWMNIIGQLDAKDFISYETDTWGEMTSVVRPTFFAGLFLLAFAELQTHASYFAIVSAIGAGFLSITEMLREIGNSACADTRDHQLAGKSDIAHKLRDLRLQHVHLVRMGRRLDKLYSPVLFTMFIFGALTASVVLFQLMNFKFHVKWHYTLGVLDYGFVPFLAMMAVCTHADRTAKAGLSVAPVIFLSKLTDIPDCRNEIHLFALQLNVYKAEFTASGFFPINHSLAGTVCWLDELIVGIAFTYSVVIIQLRGAELT